MAIHERQQTGLRGLVRRGHPASANEQGQVRAADREPEERLHQRARALRHHESRPGPRRQGIRYSHSTWLASQVNFNVAVFSFFFVHE